MRLSARSSISGICLFGLFLLPAIGYAEVLDLEGTVKAVDATARTISVERKTPKGTKTLELEVNKKAGDLSSVKVGDRITFSYDPDLELVTKIGRRENNQAAIGSGKSVLRYRLRVSDTGEVKVYILPGAPDTEMLVGSHKKLPDGQWTIDHIFKEEADTKGLYGFLGKTEHIRVNPSGRVLEMKPGPTKGYGSPVGSHIWYPVLFAPPLSVEIDVEFKKPGYSIDVFPHPSGNNPRTFFSLSRDEVNKDKLKFFAREMNGQKGTDQINEMLDASRPWKGETRLAVPNTKSDDPYQLQISCGPSNGQAATRASDVSPVVIHRLIITGKPVPIFGIQFAEQGEKIFAAGVNEGSTAERAGVKKGDVLVSVDGTAPENVAQAMAMLRKLAPGQTSTLKVLRGDATEIIEMTWNLP
jgi:hypothetical protein